MEFSSVEYLSDTKSSRFMRIPLFDNHLETSSIKRYSEVAEAMSNRQYHPIEETAEVTIWRH